MAFIPNWLIQALAFGLTSLIGIAAGEVIFRSVKGGIKAFSGGKFVSKGVAIIAFMISILLVGLISKSFYDWVIGVLMQNQTNFWVGLVIPAAIFYFVFDYLFYKR